MTGMTDEKRKALNEKLEAMTDFRGKCVKCGLEITGTLAQLRAHECKEADDGNRDSGS